MNDDYTPSPTIRAIDELLSIALIILVSGLRQLSIWFAFSPQPPNDKDRNLVTSYWS